VIGVIALAAAAFAGGAIAATNGSKQNGRAAFLNDVAKRLNVTPAQLQAALKAARLDQLDAAVKAGRLTQAQANALKQSIQNGTAAPFSFESGVHRLHDHGPLTSAARYLGLTKAQLRTQLRSGKSLAEIAKAQSKSTSGLKQAIDSAIKARLDKAVADKRITAAQEQKVLSGLSARIADLVSRTGPPKNEGPRFGPRGFGYHGLRGGFARPGSFAPAPPPPAGPAA
jgi:hypothetical protein